MKFKEFFQKKQYVSSEDPFMFSESLDSYSKIIKTEKQGNVVFYYFNLDGKQYRIFIENIEGNLHVGFERYTNKWIITGQTNDLDAKEVLNLFGTLKHVLLQQKFYSVNVSTKELKKYGLYKRMLQKLTNELNSMGSNFEFASNEDFLFLFDIDKGYSPKKFKYKK